MRLSIIQVSQHIESSSNSGTNLTGIMERIELKRERLSKKLILGIFGEIKHTKATNDVKTQTNQFDCTVLCRCKNCVSLNLKFINTILYCGM